MLKSNLKKIQNTFLFSVYKKRQIYLVECRQEPKVLDTVRKNESENPQSDPLNALVQLQNF